MAKIDKSKYNIIKEGQNEYILVSEVSEYAKNSFGSKFNIPSYRTIRYYITEGIIDRPRKLGRETYFELKYIMNIVELIKRLALWNVSINELKAITLNIRGCDQFDEALDLLDAAERMLNTLRAYDGRGDLLKQLATKRPKDIKLSEIEKELKERFDKRFRR